MTAKIIGDSVSVRVSRWEVNSFAEDWPCCNLPDRAITFRFDRKSGDLVDVFGAPSTELYCGELEALCEDAKKFAAEKIKLQYGHQDTEAHQS